MIKKFIGYLFLFYLVIAFTLSISGYTSIDLMRSGNTFFRGCAMRFHDWGEWGLPNIPKFLVESESVSGFAVIIGAFKRFANFVISICNFSINFMNMIIQLLEFIIVIITIMFKPYDLVVPIVNDTTNNMLLLLAR